MLRDSAHIQQFEAEWRNRKARRSGGEIYEPLYTMEDALGAIRLLVPCEYDKKLRFAMRLPFDLLMWDIYLVPLPLKYLQRG